MRAWLGVHGYRLARRVAWLGWRVAQEKQSQSLPFVLSEHKTPLLRRLQGVQMQLQVNKIANLRIAASCIDGLILPPGAVFSFWRLVGNPTSKRGFLPGLVLHAGQYGQGVGGGLCQMTNMIYWLTLHTQLSVVERYRHSYDVFPDANRTQPFGSGATCVYNYRDLRIQNTTNRTYQLRLWLTDTDLCGQWRADAPDDARISVEERNHRFEPCAWGGYIRSNEIWRIVEQGGQRADTRMAVNTAITMYEPMLPPAPT